MSRGNWLATSTVAGLLFALTACGTKEKPQLPNAKVEEPLVANETAGIPKKNREFADQTAQLGDLTRTNGDRGLDSELAAAVEVERNADVTVEAPFALPGLAGRSGATKEKLLRAHGGAGQPGQAARAQLLDDSAEPSSTENYQPIFENAYKLVAHDPLSTISSAVDTAAYANARARLNAGQLPPKDAVRIADFLNYFPYAYPAPRDGKPVAFALELAPCPWQPKHHLLRVGLRAKTIDKQDMPARNLVFLIDTSGSMSAENRLPLVKQSLRLLVNELTAKDRVSIVTYAGSAELLLTPTPGSEKDAIGRAIDALDAHGSTNGGGGIVMAYEQAKASFLKDGVNRVILATDGDFNVGVASDAELVRLIEQKRETGVYLTVLGYGMGNLKDSKLEQLAHHGNGHYAYIDTLDEAKKVFVEQGGSLATVAKDVKLQVEFNPAKVAAYRLVGYENRVLRHEDFRDDKKDAGDMGSGHTCTALYEVVPAGAKVDAGEVAPLKYQTAPKLSEAAQAGEWLTVRMRYKDPATDKASEVEAALPGKLFTEKPGNDFAFAACVASFGMLLRESEYKGSATYASVLETAEGLLREKKDAHREEFVKLVRVALTIDQARAKPAKTD
jgi:Ca-activated chloride channel family protein